jgi:hypothetical protein
MKIYDQVDQVIEWAAWESDDGYKNVRKCVKDYRHSPNLQYYR